MAELVATCVSDDGLNSPSIANFFMILYSTECLKVLVERQRVKKHNLPHFDGRIRSLKPTSFPDFQLSNVGREMWSK